MRTRQRISLIAVSMLLAACGAQDEAPPEPPPVKDTAFGDMVGTMDKARGVEDTTMQHKEDLDRAMQESEGGE